MNRVRFWSSVDSRLRAGENVFAALVVQHTLHSPGTTGARLIVASDGATDGTIGGGVMEFEVIKRARQALNEKEPVRELRHLYHRDDAPGEASGMICAGEQINLYWVFRPEDDAGAVSRILQACRSDRVGVVSIDASELGFEENRELNEGVQFVLTGASGEQWRFMEQVMNLRRVAIFGGGHCGLALSRTMHHLGYDVLLFETREAVHTFDENEFARSKTVVPDYTVAADLVSHPASTDAVVMTTDFASDVAALRGLAAVEPFRSVGLMGSPAKIHRIKKELHAEGVSDAFIDGLRAPIGLPIHSNTPDEIAVSVAAQVVQDRNAEAIRRA